MQQSTHGYHLTVSVKTCWCSYIRLLTLNKSCFPYILPLLMVKNNVLLLLHPSKWHVEEQRRFKTKEYYHQVRGPVWLLAVQWLILWFPLWALERDVNIIFYFGYSWKSMHISYRLLSYGDELRWTAHSEERLQVISPQEHYGNGWNIGTALNILYHHSDLPLNSL